MKRRCILHPALLALLLGSGVHGAAAAGPGAAGIPALVQARVADYLPAGLSGDVSRAAAGPFLGGPPAVTEDMARLLEVSVDHRVLGAIRDGVGVNFSLGELGGLHLNLYSRRNPKGPGQRWNLNPVAAAAATAPRLWSLGGALDLVRSGTGHRQVAFVPQLLLNLDALTDNPQRLQAFLTYARWRQAPGEMTIDEEVPQISVRLRY